MSEDWKNDRAEASMREGTEAIRKAAEERAKQEGADNEINGEWKITVIAKGIERNQILTDLINELIKLEKDYNDDNVKLSVVPTLIVKD
jgi:predicted phage-related endonuclease